MRAACFLLPQLSVAFFFEKKQSPINGLKESPTLSSTDAKESPTLPVGGAVDSPIKSANDVQAMYPVTVPMAFVEEGHMSAQAVLQQQQQQQRHQGLQNEIHDAISVIDEANAQRRTEANDDINKMKDKASDEVRKQMEAWRNDRNNGVRPPKVPEGAKRIDDGVWRVSTGREERLTGSVPTTADDWQGWVKCQDKDAPSSVFWLRKKNYATMDRSKVTCVEGMQPPTPLSNWESQNWESHVVSHVVNPAVVVPTSKDLLGSSSPIHIPAASPIHPAAPSPIQSVNHGPAAPHMSHGHIPAPSPVNQGRIPAPSPIQSVNHGHIQSIQSNQGRIPASVSHGHIQSIQSSVNQGRIPASVNHGHIHAQRSFMETPTKQSIPIGVEQHAEQESPIRSAIRTSLRGSSQVSEGEKSL